MKVRTAMVGSRPDIAGHQRAYPPILKMMLTYMKTATATRMAANTLLFIATSCRRKALDGAPCGCHMKKTDACGTGGRGGIIAAAGRKIKPSPRFRRRMRRLNDRGSARRVKVEPFKKTLCNAPTAC